MNTTKTFETIHPKGELKKSSPSAVAVETFDGRVHVEWDPQAAVTPLGQLPFFIEFLKTAELFEPWVEECPLVYTSPNAPQKRDVLGTILLSILSGHKRYAHITSIRADSLNPQLLGMSKVVSEDSVRRSFRNVDEESCTAWQTNHLERAYGPLLYEPWILDIDTTVKPLYGHQEGAKVGFNPHKPGRPSHVYHTYFVANLRLIMDVEVQPGNQSAAKYLRPSFFKFLDRLPKQSQPSFIRGDCNFGNEGMMKDSEDCEMPYLFKLRQSSKVKDMIKKVFRQNDWVPAGQGWEGVEDRLKLSGWSKR